MKKQEQKSGKKFSLKKVSYYSAIYFGIITFVFSALSGIFQVFILSKISAYSNLVSGVSKIQVILYFPLAAGILTYLFALLIIWVYNLVAKKFPISWEVKG